MGNAAKTSNYGYQCPVRGCDKKHNRRFGAMGIAMHIMYYHSIEEFEKRLRIEKKSR